MRPVILGTLIALSGCATMWARDGGTKEALNKDQWDCNRETSQVTPQDSAIAQGVMFGQCMEARGWRRQQSRQVE